MSALVVFDWDDTLFPTTFSLRDPRLRPLFHKKPGAAGRAERIVEHKAQLRALQAAAVNVLKVASQFGRVVIVTLAEEAWVRHASAMLMPALSRLLLENDVQVVSAQDFQAVTIEDVEDDDESPNSNQVRDLAALIECKAAAMRSCIPMTGDFPLDQIFSIGDSEVEAHAARQVGMERNGMHPCLHKVLKLCEMPSIEMLTAQLQTVAWWFPQAAEHPNCIFADIRSLNLPPKPQLGACPTRKVRTPMGMHSGENKENEQEKTQRKDWGSLARPMGVNTRRDSTPTPVPVPPNRLAGPRANSNVPAQYPSRKRVPNPTSKLGNGRKGSGDGLDLGIHNGVCDPPIIQAPIAMVGTAPIQRLPSIKLRHP